MQYLKKNNCQSSDQIVSSISKQGKAVGAGLKWSSLLTLPCFLEWFRVLFWKITDLLLKRILLYHKESSLALYLGKIVKNIQNVSIFEPLVLGHFYKNICYD